MLCTLVIYEARLPVARSCARASRRLPKGQMEAARALGHSHLGAMRYVILPQALYNMLPSMLSQFVSTIKETTLGYVINVHELTFAANQINNQLLTKPFQVFFILAMTYYVVCLSLTAAGARGWSGASPRKRAGAAPSAAARSRRPSPHDPRRAVTAAPRVLLHDRFSQRQQVVWRLPGAHRHQCRGEEGRGGGGLRALRLGQVDADPHRQPARGDQVRASCCSTATTSTRR